MSAREIEAKILEVEPQQVRNKLKALGATAVTELSRQSRYVFDIVKGDESRWIRVRTTEKGTTLTVKKILSDAIGDTLEYEVPVPNEDVALDMLKVMGFEPKARQVNYREAYALEGVEVTIDYWPQLQPYVEIEAESEDLVRSTAQSLGFAAEQLEGANTQEIYRRSGTDLNQIHELVFTPEEERIILANAS